MACTTSRVLARLRDRASACSLCGVVSPLSYLDSLSMDPTEAAAEAFLRGLNLGPITYEPDGNTPPDFLVGTDLAVEVRRLNQHHDKVGLEVEDIPLLQRMRKLVAELGPPVDGQTWGVFYRFSRPVERWKSLRPKVAAALEEYARSHAPNRHFANLAPSFQMSLSRYPVLKPTRFFIMGDADEDSGGSLIPIMETNIAHCISEKTAKVAPYRDRYARWWLVLVDGVGFSFDAPERDLFTQQVRLTHDWERTIVASYSNPSLFIDVRSAG